MGDYRKTTGEQTPETAVNERRAKIRFRVMLGIIFVLILLLGFFTRIPRYTLAKGYVTTMDYAEVRPPVTGIVSRILVSSGMHVEKGQVMVELKAEEEEALLSETKARVSKLQTEIERRRAEMGIDIERRTVELSEQKRAHNDKIKIAELQQQNAETRVKLTQELVEKGLKAAAHLEDDRLRLQLAQLELKSLQSKDFAIYEELLKKDQEKYNRELNALQNEMEAMMDSVKRVEAKIETRKIRAPIDGVVVRYEFVVGELLQPTHVIYEIFGGDKLVLKLNVGEKYATRLAKGQRYRALLSSYRGLERRYFRGEVEALRNVIQTRGDMSYRVAYCSFDAQGLEIPPGTTAEARIYYGTSCFWFYLFNF